MAENKVNSSFRVKSKTLYIIEVNDEGETIEFDTEDINLPTKLIECWQNIQKELSNFAKKENEIIKAIEEERKNKKPEEIVLEDTDDVNFSNVEEYINSLEIPISENEKKLLYAQKEFYERCREIMDVFLGENACQKIFGDSNYKLMFNDLFEQLLPEFEKMKVNTEKLKKDIYKKYMPKKSKKVMR